MLVYGKSFWGYRGGKARHRRQLPRTSGFPVGNQTPRCAGFHPFHLPFTKPQTTSGNRLDNHFAEPGAQEGLIASRPVAGTQHSWETWPTAGGRGAPPKAPCRVPAALSPARSLLTINTQNPLDRVHWLPSPSTLCLEDKSCTQGKGSLFLRHVQDWPSTKDVNSVTFAAFLLPAGRFKPILSSFSLNDLPPFLDLAL